MSKKLSCSNWSVKPITEDAPLSDVNSNDINVASLKCSSNVRRRLDFDINHSQSGQLRRCEAVERNLNLLSLTHNSVLTSWIREMKTVKLEYVEQVTFSEFKSVFLAECDEFSWRKGYVSSEILHAIEVNLPASYRLWFKKLQYKLYGKSSQCVYMFYLRWAHSFNDRAQFVREFTIDQPQPVPPNTSKFWLRYPSGLRAVTRSTFNATKGKYEQRKDALSVKYVTQSYEAVKNFVNGIKMVLNVLQVLGKDTAKQVKLDFDFLGLSQVLLNIVMMAESGFSVTKLISLLVSLYQTFFPVFNYMTQSWEVLALSAATFVLPKSLLEVLKRVSLLSGAKLFDDVNMFSSMFNIVIDFVKTLVCMCPVSVRDTVLPLIDMLPFGSHFTTLHKVEQLTKAWHKDTKVMLNYIFKQQVDEVIELVKDTKMIEWSRRSAAVTATLAEFKKLCDSKRAYDETSRVEPACFIFEGPAGTLKSTNMNNLIQVMRCTAFSHSIKVVGDGKDHHDTYNWEYVYFMDDVGQQGPSQWRNFINLVSCVKYPLECSDNALKHTKYFSSPVIMCTTNQFMGLTNFVRTDGVSCPEALWRRGIVFDFNEAEAREGKLYGFLSVKWFDIATNKWRMSLPPGAENTQLSPRIALDGNRITHLKWMYALVTAITNSKIQYDSDSKLSESDIDEARGEELFYEVEQSVRKGSSNTGTVTPKEIISLTKKTLVAETQSFYSAVYDLSVYLDHIRQYCVELMDDMTKFTLKTFSVRSIFFLVVMALTYFGRSAFSTKPSYLTQARFTALVEKCADFEAFDLAKSTVVSYVDRATRLIELNYDGGKIETTGMVSGHCIVMPYHNDVSANLTVNVYAKGSSSMREKDAVPVREIYANKRNDVRVVIMPERMATVYPSLAGKFSTSHKADVLITMVQALSLHTMYLPSEQVSYAHGASALRSAYSNIIESENVVRYKLEEQGVCGSPLVDANTGVVGMHVAGIAGKCGVSILWDANVIHDLNDVLIRDNKYYLNLPIHKKEYEDMSVTRLESNHYNPVPSLTKLTPSPLYGIFPVTRYPADLKATGSCTVKDIAKKSMQHVLHVPGADLNFGVQVMEALVQPFSSLTMREVILGNESLAGLNRKSSNGFGCLKGKTEYVDFDTGILTPLGAREMERVENAIYSGEIVYTDILWTETLKDELRSESKVKIPRSFRCSSVIMQLITKRIFGNLVRDLMRSRHRNGICVGINPLIEFPLIYEKLQRYNNVWACDFAKWDGAMLPQVQCAIAEVITRNIVEEKDKVIGNFILINMPYSLVLIQDDLFQMTHSMPSGSFLTAILNSLVNKFLSSCWYFSVCRTHQLSCSVGGFLSNIFEGIYGDDRINGSYDDRFGALSMAAYFESLGLVVTDDKKNKIVNNSYPISEITFLKRSFTYSPRLNTVVCPLDRNTLFSSMSWYMRNKDMGVVMEGKLGAFQREAFLHDDYFSLMNELEKELSKREWKHKFLSTHELTQLVISQDSNFLEDYTGLYS